MGVKTSTFVRRFKERFPDIEGVRVASDFGDGDGVVLLGNAAEGGVIDGLPGAEYYPDPEIFGTYYPWINPKLERFLRFLGYRVEWYDPGTLLAVEE